MSKSWQRNKLAKVLAAKAAIWAEDEKGLTLDKKKWGFKN